jgi:polar amino acid transport system substrate-binding protein
MHQFKAIVDGKPESDPISAAFPKKSKLAAEFDKAIAKAKKNGKLDELVNKWIKNQ